MAEYVAVTSASLLKSTKQSTWISSYCTTGEAQEKAQRMPPIVKGIWKSHTLELGSASRISKLPTEGAAPDSSALQTLRPHGAAPYHSWALHMKEVWSENQPSPVLHLVICLVTALYTFHPQNYNKFFKTGTIYTGIAVYCHLLPTPVLGF